MPRLIDEDLITLFDERTYERGLEYYENGQVVKPSRLEKTLFAKVIGNRPEPYETHAVIDGDDVVTWCTCPVGDMCKHGVALLLKWIHEPETFSDRSMIVQALESKSKDELLDIVKKAINDHPDLIDELKIRTEGVAASRITANVDGILNKIRRIASDDDYYSADALVLKLENIRDTAESMEHEGHYKEASVIYLELIDAGLHIFGEIPYYEEVSEEAGDFVSECVRLFNHCASRMGSEDDKLSLLDKILKIFGKDDVGLGTDELFYGIATRENIGRIEEQFLRDSVDDSPLKEGEFRFSREGAIEMLGSLYENLDLPAERIRLARCALDNKDDYARLARALLGSGKAEEAFDAVRKGLELEGGESLSLDDVYFAVASALVKQKPGLIDFDVSANVAIEALSGGFYKERYRQISGFFKDMGWSIRFTDVLIRRMRDKNMLAEALILDGRVDMAVETVENNPDADESIFACVAAAALDKGMNKESARMTAAHILRVGFEWDNYGQPSDKLLSNMVRHLDEKSLIRVCDHLTHIRLPALAEKIASLIASKMPDRSIGIARHYLREISAGTIASIALTVGKKMPDRGLEICREKIILDIGISHARYGEATSLLKIIRRLYQSNGRNAEWSTFIEEFVSDNKGKKKLINMLKEASLTA
ncbi:MAG: SWIM zinc finger family protein [Methanocella sp.]